MYIYTNDDNEVIMTSIDQVEQVDGMKEYQLDIEELPTFEEKKYYITKVLFDGLNFTAKYVLDKNKVLAAQNEMKVKLSELDYKNQKIIDAMLPQMMAFFINSGVDIDLPYTKEEITEWNEYRKTIREEFNRLDNLK